MQSDLDHTWRLNGGVGVAGRQRFQGRAGLKLCRALQTHERAGTWKVTVTDRLEPDGQTQFEKWGERGFRETGKYA